MKSYFKRKEKIVEILPVRTEGHHITFGYGKTISLSRWLGRQRIKLKA